MSVKQKNVRAGGRLLAVFFVITRTFLQSILNFSAGAHKKYLDVLRHSGRCSMIETQIIMCCKKLASNEPSSWKIILLHYLKPVGGKLILCCNYDLKRFPIKIPPFYEESI